MTNATGWAELYAGRIVDSAYTVYNTVFGGYFLGALFLLFEVLLLIKTRNPAAAFIAAIIFLPLYIGSIAGQIAAISVVITIFLLAGIFYMVMFK